MAGLNGFIKLHRKLIEWGWYSDCVVKDVFLHILMLANFEEGEYRGYKLLPGDAIIGRKQMSKDLGFSEQQIRTALKKLESTGEISLKTTNRFTIATVVNWDFYQCNEKTPTNNQPTDNQQITNNQPHRKNDKNDKNIYGRFGYYIPSAVIPPRYIPQEEKNAEPMPEDMRKKIFGEKEV